MKIALFKYSHPNAKARVIAEDEAKYTLAVRVSEWVEVEFPMHTEDRIRRALLESIESEIEQITSDSSNRTLSDLRRRAAEIREELSTAKD
jgi:hypothetical protein